AEKIMIGPAGASDTGSALGKASAVLVASILYITLAESMLDAWFSGSPLRWWVSLVVLVYSGVTVLLWKLIGYWAKAALSTMVLLALAALSTWRLGSAGAPGGLSALHLSASTLATVGVLGALGLSGSLLAGMPF